MIQTVVQTEMVGGILLMAIDNPPVNAASQAVRQGLAVAIQRLATDAHLQAGIILGTGRAFMAGSDVREFDQPLQEPQLPALIEAIEQCPKPVVAALHGAVLGGGLELALGCDARIALADTQLGLPEVRLGLIPGAGGTQRLPRCIGLVRAIELIGLGQLVTAVEALELGVLDEVVTGSLRAKSLALAQGLTTKRRLRDVAVKAAAVHEIEWVTERVLRAGKRQPAVLAAVEAVHNASTLPFDQAMSYERAEFERLRKTPEAAALRYQFFAERQVGRLPADVQALPLPIQSIAVIGAGTMGVGISLAALMAGFSVLLIDQDAAVLKQVSQRVASYIKERLRAGKVVRRDAELWLSRLSVATGWEGMAEADMVIEAVYEDMAVKHAVFRQIDRYAKQGAVLATNTSYLDVDAIAAVTSRPAQVLGLHFFSPAQVMKLLEVVKGAATTPTVLATGVAVGRRLGKLPVLCANAFGFIGNRIYNAYRLQCEFMLEDGAWPEEIDRAIESFGFAMGPFRVADLTGLDIAWRMRQAQASKRHPLERYVDVLDSLCEQGRVGRKSGAGYYVYEDGCQSTESDSTVRELIEQASRKKGIVRRKLTAEEIQRRALLAMVNEATLVLQENIAASTRDIDVVMVNGYGFPRSKGGPLYWAQQQSLHGIACELELLVAGQGYGAQKAQVAMLFAGASPR